MADDYGFVDPVIPDIGVEVYALRTFAIREGKPDSVIQSRDNYWKDGICEAVCLNYPDDPEHIAPMPSPCRCGIYGCLTVGALRQQYPEYCARIITVIAAEGKTMLGTVGLRTRVARVVAYWVAEPERVRAFGPGRRDRLSGAPMLDKWPLTEEEACRVGFPEARRFYDIGIMAHIYGLG